MSVDTNTYSNNEFKLAIIKETTIGTANVTSMQLVNVDTPITINENTFVAEEPRTGDGRTLKSADYFAQYKGQEKVISFSGIADTTVLPILAENCIGVAEASGTIDIPYNYTGTSFAHGLDNSITLLNIYTVTIALISPIAANTRIFPGCIIGDLSWTEDKATDGGRRHFSCTALTRYNPSNDQATPTGLAAYGSTYYSIWDYTQHVFGDSANDKIISAVEMTLKSNPRFFGIGTDGIPELMNRGYPTIDAGVKVNMKYDANTMSEYTKVSAGTSIEGLISDNGTIASATTGFSSAIMKLTEDFQLGNVDDGTFIDVPAKCKAGTSGNMIQIAI